MRGPLRFLFVGLVINGLLTLSPLFSQEGINPESEYLRIRDLAFSGDYSGAVVAARKLLNAYPSYGDVRILLGRVLAWQKDYVQAAAVIDTLLQTEPNNADALSARRDISLWSKENTAVATDLRVGYSFDYFTKPYSRYWQVFKAGAGHRFNWGPAAASLNIGDLIAHDTSSFYATELQIEAEAYPRLSDKNYAYVAYAFSPGKYFPTHRAAFEIWQVLPAGWEMSAGINYYYFDRNIFIGLVSVEKYLGKYWFSGKCFVYFKDNGPTTSFYLNARRYFNNFDYLQLTLGTGTAPDEPFDIQSDIMRLRAHSIRLAYNVLVTSKTALRIGIGYSREEYEKSIWRDRFDGNINLTYALKMK